MTNTSRCQPGTARQNPWRALLSSSILVGTGFAAILAWMTPQPKSAALLGRLSYGQALLAVGISTLFLLIAFSRVCDRWNRRAVALRCLSVSLGLLFGLVLVECMAWLVAGTRDGDNPWYTRGRGNSMTRESDFLMFERPPHVKWEGISRGDFAMEVDCPDPYARRVTFRTDYQGFRNSTDMRRADLVFIGDSFTEAGNVPEEETFVARVGRRLNCSVRNLGRASHCPTAELILLKEYGLPCRPRTVVWQLCENNDLTEEVTFRIWNEAGRPPVDLSGGLDQVASWKRHSPTYQLFQLLSRHEPWPVRGRFTDADDQTHLILFGKLPDSSHRPSMHEGWPLMVEALREGGDLLRKQEARLVVLLIPKKIRVMGHDVEFYSIGNQPFPENWDLPTRETLAWHLSRECEDLNVTFVDATPSLKRHAAEGELVYLPMDSHLSSQGHAVVAELIAEAVGAPPRQVPSVSTEAATRRN